MKYTRIMPVKIGDIIPNLAVRVITANTPARDIFTHDLLTDGKNLVFGIPGAFTPGCSQKHLPSFVTEMSRLKGKGVKSIFCLAVNDTFVLQAWARALHVPEDIQFIADGNCVLTEALGLSFDASAHAMGTRCHRFAMVLDGVRVEKLALEKAPGTCDISMADQLLLSGLV